MKRLKKLSIAALALVLGVAMMASSFSGFKAAKAVNTPMASIPSKIVSEVELGDDVTLPTLGANTFARVLDPNNAEVVVTNSKFNANLFGYYTVDFYSVDNGNVASFIRRIRIESKSLVPDIVVPFNGADIPSVARVGTVVELPLADFKFVDANGEEDEALREKYDNKVVTVEAKGPSGNAATITTDSAKHSFTLDAVPGVTKVQYILNWKGSYTVVKTFDITAQNEFSDSQKPTLTVSNVPTEVDVYTEVKLPKASATDTNDKNVKVEVKVVDSTGAVVKTNTIDENGKVTTNTVDAKFENSDNMKFIPTVKGTSLTVVYTATDDKNNKTTREYPVDVVDKSAPVLTIDNTLIPAVWGVNVNGNVANAEIVFPEAKVFDANDSNANPATALTASFRIVDSNNENVITATGAYSAANYTWTPTTAGTYTVKYSASDAAGRTTSPSLYSYSIEVKSTYTDETAPTVTFTSIDSYLNDGDVIKAATISVYDKDDSRVNVVTEYKYEDGTVIDIEKEEKVVASKGAIIVTVTATDDAGNETIDSKEIRTINPSDYSAATGIVSANFGSYNERGASVAMKQFVPVQLLAASNITFTGSKHDFNMGVQVIVTEPGTSTVTLNGTEYGIKGTGAVIKDVLVSVSPSNLDSDSANTSYTVNKIEFTPSKAGEYGITFVVTTTGGAQSFYTQYVTVQDAEKPIVIIDSTFPNEVELGQVITLPAVTTSDNSGSATLYLETTGTPNLNGRVFTASEKGTYSFKYYAVDANSIQSESVEKTITVVDTTAPVIMVNGAVTTYAAKDVSVALPNATATDYSGIKEITVEVKDNTGASIYKSAASAANLAFTATKDGKHTVTYTAYDNNSLSSVQSYTIAVGDIISPVISIEGTFKTRAKQGDTMNLAAATATDNISSSLTSKIVKKVYAPDGNVSTYTGGTTTTEITFEKTGEYRIVYEVTDDAGNVGSSAEHIIEVTAKSVAPTVPAQALYTVLIIVAVCLVAAAAYYFLKGKKAE